MVKKFRKERVERLREWCILHMQNIVYVLLGVLQHS